MANKRITAYWLLLTMILLTAIMTMSVGETQARYNNTTVLTTVVAAEGSPVTSDCLVAQDQQTILLGQIPLDAVTTVSFTVEASRDISAQLSWSNNQTDYLSVALGKVQIEGESETPGQLTQNNLLELTCGSKATIYMTLTPTEVAMATEHPELEVNVGVKLGDLLSGTFRTGLAAVELPDAEETDPTDPSAPTQGEEEGTGDSNEENTDGGSTDSGSTGDESSETGGTDGGSTDPTEAMPAAVSDEMAESAEPAAVALSEVAEDIPAALAEEDTIPATESTEAATEPTTEPTEPTQAPPTEPSTPTEPVEDPTDPTKPAEKEEQNGIIEIGTISSFDPASLLPVSIQPVKANSRVVLGLGAGNAASQFDMTEFPAYTRYSFDGENYFMLYYGGFVELENTDGSKQSLLLDVSRIDNTPLILVAQEALNGSPIGACTVTATADTTISDRLESAFLTNTITSFNVALPSGWLDSELQLNYNLEFLTAAGYQAVPGGTLNMEYVQDTENATHALMVSYAGTWPAAGTYRLNMNWTYEGICFKQTQMTFFINYSETA